MNAAELEDLFKTVGKVLFGTDSRVLMHTRKDQQRYHVRFLDIYIPPALLRSIFEWINSRIGFELVDISATTLRYPGFSKYQKGNGIFNSNNIYYRIHGELDADHLQQCYLAADGEPPMSLIAGFDRKKLNINMQDYKYLNQIILAKKNESGSIMHHFEQLLSGKDDCKLNSEDSVNNNNDNNNDILVYETEKYTDDDPIEYLPALVPDSDSEGEDIEDSNDNEDSGPDGPYDSDFVIDDQSGETEQKEESAKKHKRKKRKNKRKKKKKINKKHKHKGKKKRKKAQKKKKKNKKRIKIKKEKNSKEERSSGDESNSDEYVSSDDAPIRPSGRTYSRFPGNANYRMNDKYVNDYISADEDFHKAPGISEMINTERNIREVNDTINIDAGVDIMDIDDEDDDENDDEDFDIDMIDNYGEMKDPGNDNIHDIDDELNEDDSRVEEEPPASASVCNNKQHTTSNRRCIEGLLRTKYSALYDALSEYYINKVTYDASKNISKFFTINSNCNISGKLRKKPVHSKSKIYLIFDHNNGQLYQHCFSKHCRGKQKLVHNIWKCEKFHDSTIAEWFISLYPRWVSTMNDKGDIHDLWYKQTGTVWKLDIGSAVVTHDLQKKFLPRVTAILKEKLHDATDEAYQKAIQSAINMVTKKINDEAPLAKVIKSICKKTFVPDLVWNETKFEHFVFQDRMFDLDRQCFRDLELDEYVNDTAGVEYVYQPKAEVKDKIDFLMNDWLKKIFQDSRDAVLKAVSLGAGTRTEKWATCFYGPNGDNGKTAFVSLLKAALGGM